MILTNGNSTINGVLHDTVLMPFRAFDDSDLQRRIERAKRNDVGLNALPGIR